MDHKISMMKFVISSVSINTDPDQLSNLQEPKALNQTSHFSCRPPVDMDDATVLVDGSLQMKSDDEALAVSLSASAVFQFDAIPEDWIDSVKSQCTSPFLHACTDRVQDILKLMGITVSISQDPL